MPWVSQPPHPAMQVHTRVLVPKCVCVCVCVCWWWWQCACAHMRASVCLWGTLAFVACIWACGFDRQCTRMWLPWHL